MNGGLIEGLKMCFRGENVLNSHLGLLTLLIGICLPLVDIKLKTNIDKLSMIDVFNYNFLYGILLLICMAGLTLFLIRFIHNAIQLNIYQDFEKDPEKVKNMTIMPKFDKTLLNNWAGILKFFFIWTIYYILILIPVFVLSFIPFVNILVILGFAILIAYSGPYIVTGFAAQYKTNGNLDISLVFKYFPKVFSANSILILKSIPFALLITLVSALLSIIAITIFRGMGEFVSVFIATLIYSYIFMLFQLAYNYALTFIFYNKIFLTRDV